MIYSQLEQTNEEEILQPYQPTERNTLLCVTAPCSPKSMILVGVNQGSGNWTVARYRTL